MELETQLQIARRLNYVDTDSFNPPMDKASVMGRMLKGLRKSLAKKSKHYLPTPDPCEQLQYVYVRSRKIPITASPEEAPRGLKT
ncbi:MAG: hypothetical protein HYR55_14135 [Acidobacteria bacterium]|nr:hypothetical protein [Acidobacteriota bacterium]MBI3654858.1 hypothetical protein [Acidobacteriota bacterium]